MKILHIHSDFKSFETRLRITDKAATLRFFEKIPVAVEVIGEQLKQAIEEISENSGYIDVLVESNEDVCEVYHLLNHVSARVEGQHDNFSDRYNKLPSNYQLKAEIYDKFYVPL